MQSRLIIYLTENERHALEKLGEIELRPMKDQAQFLIRQSLEERGLLKPLRQEPQEKSTPKTGGEK
jgi:hypothetical protein